MNGAPPGSEPPKEGCVVCIAIPGSAATARVMDKRSAAGSVAHQAHRCCQARMRDGERKGACCYGMNRERGTDPVRIAPRRSVELLIKSKPDRAG